MEDFFKVLQMEELVSRLVALPQLGEEELPLEDCRGRFLARDVYAPEDLPANHRSAMDGYAVQARETFGASESNPVYLEKTRDLGICEVPDFQLSLGYCAGIVTGGILPQGADAVVMQEYAQEIGGDTLEVRRPVAPWENIMFQGEDTGQGELALRAGQRVGFRQTAVLAGLGFKRWSFFKPPRVGIISTGDELKDIQEDLEPGRIRDINSYALGHLVQEAGGTENRYGIIRDREEDLLRALEQALEENDVVLISGGSSVGQRDMSLQAMQRIPGLEIVAHGLAISPGKPTIFAQKGNRYIWGLPGQVGSAQVVMLALVAPFLEHLQGAEEPFSNRDKELVPARLSRNLASKYGRRDYVRVRLERDASGYLAHPVLGKSGLLRTVVQADGLIRIPANCEGYPKGEQVQVRLIR